MVWRLEREKRKPWCFLSNGACSVSSFREGARHAVVVLSVLMLSTAAIAENPDPAFSYDKVLVTSVQPYDAADLEVANQITAQWAQLLAKDAVVLEMDRVPVFETQGYDAQTYMRSCPVGSYAGCALVVGSRVDADWSIGATLDRVMLGADGSPMWSLTVHVVDVSGAVEVVSFALTYDASLQEVLSEGVRSVFQEVLHGVHHGQDIRADARVSAEDSFDRMAQTLEGLERSLGAIEQRDSVRVITPPKLTQEDLGAYREGESPWERLNLSEGSYVRFRNSGLFLNDWTRRRSMARGALSVRAGVHGGTGPWGVSYQGAYLRDPNAGLQVVGTREMLSSVQGGSVGGGLDLGVGLTGWLEAGVSVGARSVTVEVLEDAQLLSESPNLTAAVATTQGRALLYGGYLRAVSRPAFTIRPGLHMGAGLWLGPSYQPSDEQLRGVSTSAEWVACVKPLVEVRLADHYGLVAGVGAQGRLGAGVPQESRTGDASALSFPTSSPPPGWGLSVSLELQARIRLKKAPLGPARPEPLLLGDEP